MLQSSYVDSVPFYSPSYPFPLPFGNPAGSKRLWISIEANQAPISSVRWTWVETKYLGPPGFICRIYQILSGWWFGTFFCFSIYWEFHHPNWQTPSFFRGVGLNHQPVMTFCTTLHHFSSLFHEFLRISSEFLILSDLFRFHISYHFIRFGS